MEHQAKQLELTAQRREVSGKAVRHLRRDGAVPAVLYGHGFEPLSLQLDSRAMHFMLAGIKGSQLIKVNIVGQAEPENALIRQIQRNPVTGELLHIDLYRVRMTERITANISVEFVGESPALKISGTLLLHGINSVEVECLPADLFESFRIDLSTLVETDDAIHVSDLKVGEGVKILTDADEMIVRVATTREEAAPVAAEGAAEVEVITKSKSEEA